MALISVVMASKNPLKDRLTMAIMSVLNQTFVDFELIIVDDGSNVPIGPLMSDISNDRRIKLFRIPASGLGAALNHGIQRSCGKYIARIDDDDLMCPKRLQKQFNYLEKHPDVSCLGTQIFDKVNNRYRMHRHFPETHDEIVREMLINIRFQMAHTSLMFRRNSFDKIGGYRILGGGQDADLILQMSRVGKLANLSEYLTFYTMSASGLGTVNPNKRKAYLFAFEEILTQNTYPAYEDSIKQSITKLKHQIAGGEKVAKNIFIRKLLALRVLFLGKEFKFENM